jgi:hypothetical protein
MRKSNRQKGLRHTPTGVLAFVCSTITMIPLENHRWLMELNETTIRELCKELIEAFRSRIRRIRYKLTQGGWGLVIQFCCDLHEAAEEVREFIRRKLELQHLELRFFR